MKKKNIYCINHYCCYDLDLQSDSICRRRCCGSSGKYLNSAQSQIKTIVNNVVFPVIDVILAILLFAKLGMLYPITASMDRSNGLRRRFYSVV